MSARFGSEDWGLILGGSSGFGLATAHKLAAEGMNLCVVHRDRRGSMSRIEPEFEKIRGHGIRLVTHNVDALSAEKRAEVIAELRETLGSGGKLRMLLHSIAFGNLKLLAPEPERTGPLPAERLAEALGVDAETLREAVDRLFAEGDDALGELATPPSFFPRQLDAEDFARTIYSMGTSLVDWVQDVFREGLFAPDARVFGLTSEGNAVAWKGYAAVSAAKVAMEAACRSIAAEFGPHGLRCNVLQPGVTETPALQAIPGSDRLKAHSRLRNPLGRITTPADVAAVVFLLCQPEAAWINGVILRVDGGEHISGSTV